MATLERGDGRATVMVEPELVIGRLQTCGLRLSAPYVSSVHATLRWYDSRWEVKDLGSRNGTWLNGELLMPGQTYPLTQGARLTFGHEQEIWRLSDDSAPRPMLMRVGDGAAVLLEQDVVGIPDDEDPEVMLLRDANGVWRAERIDGESIPLEHRGTFEAGGHRWRFAVPESVGATSVLASPEDLPSILLKFTVSHDEEHVELRVESNGHTFELGARGHNYLLLTLARLRLDDVRRGTRSSASGWTYVDDLEKLLKTKASRLNIDIFRIRQQFSRLGLGNVLNIVERRHRAKQLRIGTDAIDIQML